MRSSAIPVVTLALCLTLSLYSHPAIAQETPNAKLMKTDLLVVTAHPDDESMMAGTMARYADEGKVVSLVTATHGEGGGNGTGKEGGGSLGIVREAELRECLRLLGTRYLYFLNQQDWAYTESVRATLNKWGAEESLRRLVRLVRILRPEVVCTMDPAPTGGQHGHHQAAGRLATEAFEAAADPRAFPEQIEKEGLAPWRVRKLYWVSFGGSNGTRLTTDGMAKGAMAALHPGKRYADISLAAEMNHRSQGFDKFLGSMARSGQAPARPENFLLVKSRVPVDTTGEKDLFDGIAGADVERADAQHDILGKLLPSPPPQAPVTARIQPDATIRNYREWLSRNGISRLLKRLPAHATALRGQKAVVYVEVSNNAPMTQKGKIQLTPPSEWQGGDQEKPFTLRPGQNERIAFTLSCPQEAKIASQDIRVRVLGAEDAAGDSGKLDVIPSLLLSPVPSNFSVDADLSRWEKAGIKPVALPPTNMAQGSVRGPEELSGQFFAGWNRQGLHVLVDVTDDTVVANIAPDDIKAHWRSTSVEICVAPSTREEDTSDTFHTVKLGIFPQDTTGVVRAARDADENPGPVDAKSGFLLASKRTPKGYIVEVLIPWRAMSRLKSVPMPSQTLAFNVILYHAGKKEARVGEDIGKSRLAWSFWPGVWGRPERWGYTSLSTGQK